MLRRARPHRAVLITTVPESPGAEFDRRRRRYAIMAVIFTGCFAAGALLHRYTVVALVLCGVAMVVLPLAVITANIRSRPRSARVRQRLANERRHLSAPRTDHHTAN